MPVPEKLRLIAQQYALNAERVSSAIENIPEDDFYRSPAGMNSLLWILGHLANTRLGIVSILGGQAERPWNELFGNGSKPGDRASLPSVAEVRAAWPLAVAALNAQMQNVTDEELDKPASRPMPLEDKSALAAAAFLASHEMYHLGQIAALRKWLSNNDITA